MYHEVTSTERATRRRKRIIALVALAIVAVLMVAVYEWARQNAREQGAAALRQSILDASIRCCAVEGSYPLSLSHLEECYGLRINHNDYIVTYEAFASNIAPSVVVVPR